MMKKLILSQQKEVLNPMRKTLLLSWRLTQLTRLLANLISPLGDPIIQVLEVLLLGEQYLLEVEVVVLEVLDLLVEGYFDALLLQDVALKLFTFGTLGRDRQDATVEGEVVRVEAQLGHRIIRLGLLRFQRTGLSLNILSARSEGKQTKFGRDCCKHGGFELGGMGGVEDAVAVVAQLAHSLHGVQNIRLQVSRLRQRLPLNIIQERIIKYCQRMAKEGALVCDGVIRFDLTVILYLYSLILSLSVRLLPFPTEFFILTIPSSQKSPPLSYPSQISIQSAIMLSNKITVQIWLFHILFLHMGQTISGQQAERLRHERIDRIQLEKMINSIKTEEDIEAAIKQFLSIMTLKEKIGQLQQISYGDETLSPQIIKQIAEGAVGSFLNVWKLDNINQMQKIAMEQSRLKIPLIIGKDVIHGYRTVFPIPLAQAASFNPTLVQSGSRIAAVEASSMGIKWTFTPMVDIARDPRWGRIAEGFGEDPYLASILGAAVVKGFQSKNLKDITAVAACGKHYVGYGATEGGRDYNTTLIPENTLRDIYLPPFKELCQSGCLTYMSAFNDLNGEPSTANQFTLKQVLRNQWKFDGIVVSDYTAVSELIIHGFAENERDAARRAFNSGLDMEMVSSCFYDNLEDLLSKQQVSMDDLNTKVANILRVKFKMNLFENYYTDPSRQSIILDPKHKEAAKTQATQCPVLLRNQNKTLPISKTVATLAIIGKLADDPENQIGTWAPDAQAKDSITPLTSLKAALPSTKIIYAQGYKDTRSTDDSYFNDAIAAANQVDRVLLFLGEDNGLSGESNCRAYINLPGVQQELVRQIAKTGKPIAAIIYAGRSLLLQPILPYVDSLLYAWHLGTMAGPALADLLLGNISPSGKLPVTFPRAAGQIPLYYNKKNTGRPNDTHVYQPFTSSWIDIDPTPLFPFGFGLSYSSFSYSNLKLSKTVISFGESMIVSATVKNQGTVRADQTVFLFIRDLVGSYTRPVKELKDFERVTLSPGESTSVSFVLNSDKLRFWTMDKEFKAQAGRFNVWIGKNAEEGLQGSFDLLSKQAEFELLQ